MFLNIKTEYNFLTSLCKLEELIDFAKEQELKCLGIVDKTFNISNLKFIQLCQANNIKPLIGVEKSIKNSNVFNVTFYAKNELGIEYLNKLPKELKSLDTIDLTNISLVIKIDKIIQLKNLTKTSTDLLKADDVFLKYNENLFLSLLENEVEQEILNLVKNKMIYDEEICFIQAEELEAYIALRAIKANTKYLEEKVNKDKYKHLSFESKIKKITHIDSTILTNTKHLIQNIQAYNLKYDYQETLNFEQYKNVNFPELLTAKLTKYLEAENLREKTQIYQTRLFYEIEVINKLNFVNYFLIMQQIINYCNEEQIKYGYGRGSAAGSLVCFLLDITKLDPVKYSLYFERFLNLKRVGLPDIDLDVSDIHRQQIINYLITYYGENKVAKIYTINRYLVKSAFNDLAKTLDFNKELTKKISQNLSSQLTFEQNIEKNYKFFGKYLADPKFDFLREVIAKIENLPKTSSIHAAGIIISAIDVQKLGYLDPTNQVLYNEAKTLEQNGFIKFDLLALANLSFISELEAAIKEVNPKFDAAKIPLTEPLVYKNLSLAKTLGIFQLESTGIKNLLQKYKPTKFTDIAIIISLYRPGPMQNIETYLKNKTNYPKINYLHDNLKPILEPTYGIFIYQEQIIEVVQIVAKFTLQEADVFRVAISKKNNDKLQEQKIKFLKQGQKNGYSEQLLNKLFNDIEKFANYGFNKAHAYSYARLIYQLMYLKSKYPTIFYNKLFKTNINSPQKEEFLIELYSNNIIVQAPSIIECSYENIIARGKIVLGLNNLQGINNIKLKELNAKVNEFKANNDFSKLNCEEILKNCIIPMEFTKEELQSLIHSGFLDELMINRKSLERTLLKYDNETLKILNLTGETLKLQLVEDYSFAQKIELEQKSLNFNIKYTSKNYLILKMQRKYKNEKLTNLTYLQKDLQLYKDYFILGLLVKVTEITTKNREKMAFLIIKYHNFEIELVCFKEEYQKYAKLLKSQEKLQIFKIQKSKKETLVVKEIIT